MSDHVHMMISIPPKYAVSQVVGREQQNGNSCQLRMHIVLPFAFRKCLEDEGQRIYRPEQQG